MIPHFEGNDTESADRFVNSMREISERLGEVIQEIVENISAFFAVVTDVYKTIEAIKTSVFGETDDYDRYGEWREIEKLESARSRTKTKTYLSERANRIVILRGNVKIGSGKKAGHKKAKEH